jgi:iron complex outermembrane receptor protein
MDWIDDKYEPRAPSTGSTTHASRSAFSPRAGANLRWLRTARQEGNVYLTGGRSFKAPTMDQLFDQRRTPVNFPPFAITTSNPTLEAQYGTSVEAGAYHRVSFVPDRVAARLSLSAYQTDMRNELDFDLKTFKYVNIGRSRHRGVEAGLNLDGPEGLGAFASYSLQHATARNGGDAGRYLKAIPRNVLTAGLSRAARTGLSATLGVTTVGDTFLDDPNTITLPGHTQVDLRASYPVLATRLTLDLRNLFGSEYSSTGFPDPAGGKTTFYYPAAGRVVIVGLESRW